MAIVPFFINNHPGSAAKCAVFLSGQGSNAEQLLNLERNTPELQRTFEITVLVTDAPESSRTEELAQAFNKPVAALDIKKFYQAHNLATTSLATEAGRQVRQLWTEALRVKLQSYEIDFGVLAGFVPLTNLTSDFPCLNVHPGDLTYLEDNKRQLVGLHTIPIEKALVRGLPALRSSVIIAEPYTDGGSDMDCGPLLGISPEMSIDYSGFSADDFLKMSSERSKPRPKGGYSDPLRQLASKLQSELKEAGDWIVLPPVTRDFAAGCFGHDGQQVYFRSSISEPWQKVRTVEYNQHGERSIWPEEC